LSNILEKDLEVNVNLIMKIIITSDINPNNVGDGIANQKHFIKKALEEFLQGFGFDNVNIITEEEIPGNDQELGELIRKNINKKL